MQKETATITGKVDPAVLMYTAGEDTVLDRVLVEVDCIGTAAHVTMLSRMPVSPPLFTEEGSRAVIDALVEVIRKDREGRFEITPADQDVHMAVERCLTAKLGDMGKRVHTGRSRNDQVALDLRLYTKVQLLSVMRAASTLAEVLLRVAQQHQAVPMAGRTHLQPAMPSSVGLWASAHAESLLDDLEMLEAVYQQNNRSPLGSAAGYGVPLPIDRALTAQLLGFERPVHNVLYASMTRGRCEMVTLNVLSQVMLSVSRLAEDMVLFMMPEFGYFRLPAAYCTGSSIMPQKQNPDVFELARARSATVLSRAWQVSAVMKGMPAGYQRDLQETKAPLMEGLRITTSTLETLALVMNGLEVDEAALRRGFSAGVFATDWALELVRDGVPFRDAYDRVKADLATLEGRDPAAAITAKMHEGAPGGLDLAMLESRRQATIGFVNEQRECYDAAVSQLLGCSYPDFSD